MSKTLDTLHNVTMYQIESGKLSHIIHAKHAKYTDDQWQLKHVTDTVISDRYPQAASRAHGMERQPHAKQAQCGFHQS